MSDELSADKPQDGPCGSEMHIIRAANGSEVVLSMLDDVIASAGVVRSAIKEHMVSGMGSRVEITNLVRSVSWLLMMLQTSGGKTGTFEIQVTRRELGEMPEIMWFVQMVAPDPGAEEGE